VWKSGAEEIITNPLLLTAVGLAELNHLSQVLLRECQSGQHKWLLYLAHLVDDFFGKLKGGTKGYASLDYEESAWRAGNIAPGSSA
jgi:translation elongation factor EF-4